MVMFSKVFGKRRIKERKASSIDEFRTSEFRVFLAPSYFSSDLERDIRWHKKHLNKLLNYRKNPKKFHKQFPSVTSDDDKERHFKEQVIDSIPFHQEIIEYSDTRLEAILSLIPRKYYKKIVKITKKCGGLPEYFVYDKFEDDFFFVVDEPDQKKVEWAGRIKEKSKICDVVFLNSQDKIK